MSSAGLLALYDRHGCKQKHKEVRSILHIRVNFTKSSILTRETGRIMGNIQTVGPNEALVVSGGCCRPSRKQIIVGGWCWSTWMLTNVQRISLQSMTVKPECAKVQSCVGVPVTVNAVVHCKIMSNSDSLHLAAEQFLGKSRDEIQNLVKHTIEGHMRAVIGTQTMENICRKRYELANLIRESSHTDLFKMGIDVMSLTVHDIKDEVDYLKSAGEKLTARVKRDSAIVCAKAESEASQVKDECQHEQKECEQENESKLSELRHNLQMQHASLKKRVSEAKAEAEKAYDLTETSMQRDIREMTLEVEGMRCDGQIKIKSKDTDRRKVELEMEYDLPTKSKIYELKKQAEAYKEKMRFESEAEECRISEEGKAQAEAVQLVGSAEAEGLKILAEAREEFNDAAILAEAIKILPEVAAEIASPLTRFEEIVLISDKNSVSIDGTKATRIHSSNAAEAAKLSSSMSAALKAVDGKQKVSGNLISSIMKLQKSAA